MFVPFQQSSLFQNIASGQGTPIGHVPMNFATATPYKWNTDPITPAPEVPAVNFDMGVFCSLPQNANHPMCQQQDNRDNNNRDDKDDERDYFSIKDMQNLDDESLIDYLKDGWLGNSMIGFLPSKGNIVTVNKPLMTNPLLSLAFGKQNDMRRNFMIEELTKRGFAVGKNDKGEMQFNIDPQLYKKNLDKAVAHIIHRQDNENDTVPVIEGGNVVYKDADRSGGTKPTSSHLTRDDGRRDEKKYQKALRENIIRSVKNTNPKIKSKYSKVLGGFYGGR